jgi:hypothetical protein
MGAGGILWVAGNLLMLIGGSIVFLLIGRYFHIVQMRRRSNLFTKFSTNFHS